MGAQVIIYGPNDAQLADFQRVAPEGVEVEWVDSTRSLDDQAAELQDAQVAIVAGTPVTVEVASRAPNLKLVQTTSAGTDMLDKTALGEMGIRVSNNGGGNAVAVAEHTIALLVSTIRKMQLQFNAVKAGEWAADIRQAWFSQANEIQGKTVGIVGLGRIGSRVARRLQGWECDIIYTDVVDPEAGIEEELNLRRVSLDELLQESDIITLHVPLGEADVPHDQRPRIRDDEADRGFHQRLSWACRGRGRSDPGARSRKDSSGRTGCTRRGANTCRQPAPQDGQRTRHSSPRVIYARIR